MVHYDEGVLNDDCYGPWFWEECSGYYWQWDSCRTDACGWWYHGGYVLDESDKTEDYWVSCDEW